MIGKLPGELHGTQKKGVILGVDSFSIPFKQRSVQTPIAVSFGVLGGCLETRMPGKNWGRYP